MFLLKYSVLLVKFLSDILIYNGYYYNIKTKRILFKHKYTGDILEYQLTSSVTNISI